MLGPVHSVIKAYTERICLKACQESACISFLNMLLLWKNGSQKRNISNHIRIVHTMNAVPALVCTDCEKKITRRTTEAKGFYFLTTKYNICYS